MATDVNLKVTKQPTNINLSTGASEASLKNTLLAAKTYRDESEVNKDLTYADVVSTNADVVTTNANVVITNADVVQTTEDKAGTLADVTNTADHLAQVTVLHDEILEHESFPKKIVGTNIEGTTLANVLTHTESSGVINGCAYTDNLDGTLTIAGGTALMRIANDHHAEMHTVEIVGSTLAALPDNTTSYVYATYSGDGLTPATISSTTSDSVVNLNNIVPIYTVTREANVLVLVDVRFQNVDFVAKNQRRMFEIEPYAHAGGNAIAGAGSFLLSITEGSYYFQTVKITAPSMDMSGVGVVDMYYGSGGSFTKLIDQSPITAQYYETTSLAAITTNKYACQWIYAILDTEGNSRYAILYGTQVYNTSTQAKEETIPTDAPDTLLKNGILIGRLIVSDTEINAAESRFDGSLSAAGVAEHSALAGLQGGTGSGATAEHYHLTQLEHGRVNKRTASATAHVGYSLTQTAGVDGNESAFIPATQTKKVITDSFTVGEECDSLHSGRRMELGDGVVITMEAGSSLSLI